MTDTVDMPAEAASDEPASPETVSNEPVSEEAAPEITVESVVEALLFSTDVPLPATKIAQLLGSGDAGDVKGHIDKLNEGYERSGAAFRIESIAKGYQMLTLGVYNNWLAKLHKVRAESQLSQAALETLAIVAYRQPVLRADIEAVRGVAVGDMLVRLREMNLARIVGRAEEIGRPLLYGTTTKFLEVFGLGSLKDLPKVDQDNPEAVPPLRVVKDVEEDVETTEDQEDQEDQAKQADQEVEESPSQDEDEPDAEN